MTKPLEWATLPEERKEKIKSFHTDMVKLIEFGNKANETLFVFLYGEQMGKHFWAQFCKQGRNIAAFINYLDVNYREILLSNVLGHDAGFGAHPLYAHCY